MRDRAGRERCVCGRVAVGDGAARGCCWLRGAGRSGGVKGVDGALVHGASGLMTNEDQLSERRGEQEKIMVWWPTYRRWPSGSSMLCVRRRCSRSG